MEKDSNIVVFGGRGLVGSSAMRTLAARNYSHVEAPRSNEVDLLDKQAVETFFANHKPEFVFMIAGLVGGIVGNKKRNADFLYQNATMILNILEAARKHTPTAKILYTGSTCVYPKENPQPISENRFLQGPFEPTNKGYAMAKSLGIVACELYRQQYNLNCIAVMPTNMYGPNDTYDLDNGHMIPSLIKKFLEGKKNTAAVTLWGSGRPRREALFTDDCADVLVYLMNHYDSSEIVNIGTGVDYSIREFADIIAKEIGFTGEILWDTSKPDGVLEKRTDISTLKKIYPAYNPRSLQDGVRHLIQDEDELSHILRKI